MPQDVRAPETHGAAVFHPNGALALHLYCVNGALFGAQTAAYAGLLDGEVAGTARFAIVYPFADDAGWVRRGDMHVLTDNFCYDRALDLLNLSIGIAVYISYARLVGQIEQRSPCAGHLHVKQDIERKAFALHDAVRHGRRSARCGTERAHIVQVGLSIVSVKTTA